MMPKIKNTKKHSNRTLPSIGNVSKSNITKILIPVQKEMEEKINSTSVTLKCIRKLSTGLDKYLQIIHIVYTKILLLFHSKGR